MAKSETTNKPQRYNLNLDILINEFMKQIIAGNIEVYNEFSLQHELGIYLRERLEGLKVQFERNISFFNINNTVKREIDIVIFNEDMTEKYAVELKYPLNGQYPVQMYKFTEDIKFMEELKDKGFVHTYCLTLVEDRLFYSGRKTEGIYEYYRVGRELHGDITNSSGETITLDGHYSIEWNRNDDNDYAYYLCCL